MRYYVLDPVGSIENLQLREGAVPVPRGDTDVVVKVKAATLNYKDLVLALGWLPLNNGDADYVPLSDGAGKVVGVGPGVRNLQPGDRVVPSFFPDWETGEPAGDEKSLGRELTGMLAEYVCLPEQALVRIPDSMSYAEAAAFPCAGVTAWHALCEKGPVTEEHTVLTLGTGGVSMFALQIAKAKGATVIATTGSAEKAQLLHRVGADHVINYRETEEWDKEVLRLTDGKGADIIVEVGGAQTFQKSMNAAAFGGRISCVGVLAGVDGHADPTSILFKSLSVDGVYVGNTQMLHDVIAFYDRNRLRPIMDAETFPFEDAGKAYARLLQQSHFGKIALQIQ